MVDTAFHCLCGTLPARCLQVSIEEGDAKARELNVRALWDEQLGMVGLWRSSGCSAVRMQQGAQLWGMPARAAEADGHCGGRKESQSSHNTIYNIILCDLGPRWRACRR